MSRNEQIEDLEIRASVSDNLLSLPRPAARFVVRFSLEGFETEVAMAGTADDLLKLVAKLKGIGAVPIGKSSPAASNRESAPVCNLHNKPMKKSQYGDKWICTARLADQSYCKETA